MYAANRLPAERGPAQRSAAGLSVTSGELSDGVYSELFVQHRTAIYRLACLLTGDVHVAEEVTAEVFARVLINWRRGAVSEPLPYLRRAVVNEIRSRWRRWGHEQRALSRADVGVDASMQTDRLALREPLVAALAALPPRQRAVVVLRYVEDLSEAEVARVLRSSPGTVKSQASRGLAALRSILEVPA